MENETVPASEFLTPEYLMKRNAEKRGHFKRSLAHFCMGETLYAEALTRYYAALDAADDLSSAEAKQAREKWVLESMIIYTGQKEYGDQAARYLGYLDGLASAW